MVSDNVPAPVDLLEEAHARGRVDSARSGLAQAVTGRSRQQPVVSSRGRIAVSRGRVGPRCSLLWRWRDSTRPARSHCSRRSTPSFPTFQISWDDVASLTCSATPWASPTLSSCPRTWLASPSLSCPPCSTRTWRGAQPPKTPRRHTRTGGQPLGALVCAQVTATDVARAVDELVLTPFGVSGTVYRTGHEDDLIRCFRIVRGERVAERSKEHLPASVRTP